MTRPYRVSASSAGCIHSQRPWSPGITTIGFPDPRSNINASFVASIPQRLPGLQRVRDALQGLALAAEAEERFTLQVEHLLLVERRRVREVAAGEDPGELASDRGVVIADAAGAPREVDAELQRREHA